MKCTLSFYQPILYIVSVMASRLTSIMFGVTRVVFVKSILSYKQGDEIFRTN